MDYRDVILDNDFDIYQSSKYESNPIYYDRESSDIVKVYYYSRGSESIYYHAYKSDHKYDFVTNETIYYISEVLFHKKFASIEDIRDSKIKELLNEI